MQEELCEIPYDRLMEAPVFTGRLSLLWSLDGE